MISGPVDFVAVGFPGGGLNEELIANLMELVDSGVVRIIDAVVVIKDEEGEVTALEVEDLDAATAAMLAPLANDLTGMVSFEDIAMIAEELENDSRVAMILFENLWSVKLREAALRSGGQLLMHVRLPDEAVQQAWEDMSGI
ncbi:MAG: DUF1269 domain-containing protein [Caldilineae bacterium]|nr:DUF1269 domain-containing protein [Anaerolineae bacterium]MCB0200179.1 DUF1269 domain-containing protein [Anaerolineae bacterium]MCB0205079.1 DUF1269 domain-containing protein [Anaerolineae bacterium]MCB0252363.1 DUF1269 domain-containing protein [Anaerolineae bacterium]MCB9152659.1 DUF1269 domain-containing protein [Caldilineae bacterium]